jgi:hypothetical protein
MKRPRKLYVMEKTKNTRMSLVASSHSIGNVVESGPEVEPIIVYELAIKN